MSFLLDTNILSAHIRRPSGLSHQFIQHSGHLYISTISLAEFFVWIFRRDDPATAVSAIERVLRYEVSAIKYDEACAREFGKTRAALRREGLEVNPVDLMIASVALVYDLTLVTNNTKDFRNIPDLRCEDWLSS